MMRKKIVVLFTVVLLAVGSVSTAWGDDVTREDGTAAVHLLTSTAAGGEEEEMSYEPVPLDVSDTMVESGDFPRTARCSVIPAGGTFRFDSGSSAADPSKLTVNIWGMHQGQRGWYAEWFRLYDAGYEYPAIDKDSLVALPFEYDRDYLLDPDGKGWEYVMVSVVGGDGGILYWIFRVDEAE